MTMRISISTQLFAVMLGLCLVVILAMGLATTWTLRQGFDEFTRKQDSQRAEAVAATLAEFYRQQGSWTLLKVYPQLWYDILSMDTSDHDSAEDITHRPVVPRRLRAHWSLLDPQGRVIAGNLKPSGEAQRFGIVIGGEYVGQLVVSARQRTISRGEQRFLEQQRRSSMLIMLLSAALALLAALLLARRFLAPIRQLAHGTQQLSTGQYDTQIPANRQDELGQLARDFNRLAATLGNNERMRRNFVADISHELRTPLAILKGELEAIQDGIRKPTPDAINSLQNEVTALTRLVDDLYQLALSDVGALRYQFHEFDLAESVEQTCSAFQERLLEHGLTLRTELPAHAVYLEGDEKRLQQLVGNLLENSVRYTDAGGVVEVKLSVHGEMIWLDIQDTAPSVAPADLPRLFERLYRVEASRNRATGGAGLGLPLCQTIVEAHGGKIHASPSSMGGLWLHIELPQRQPEPKH